MWREGETTPLAVFGERFFPRVVTDFTEPSGIYVDAEYALALAGPTGSIELQEVRWFDASRFTAVAAPSVPVGQYDVVLTDPWQRQTTLSGAVRVIPFSSTACQGDNDCTLGGCAVPGACAGGYCERLGCLDCWWDAQWRQRVRLEIDRSGVTETLTDVPVLIALDTSHIDVAATAPEGIDLRFTLAGADCTVPVDHEISNWRPTGSSAVWVRVPQLPAGQTTALYLYYENSAAPTIDLSAAVWSPSYVGVWHLEEEPTVPIHDSSASGKHGTASGLASADLVDCYIGRCFMLDGIDDHVRIPSADSPDVLSLTDVLTMEAWIRRRDPWTNNWQVIVARQVGSSSADGYSMAIDINDPSKLSMRLSETGFTQGPGGEILVDTWHHVAATRNAAGDGVIYVDGQILDSVSGLIPLLTDDNDVTIGGQENGPTTAVTEMFRGEIDEVRISNVAHSQEWIETQYRSMSGLLVTFGGIENL